MRFRRFQSRLLFFFLGLFVLVQAAAFYAVSAAHARNARAQIDAQLELVAGVFRQIMDNRTERLVEAARLLAGDFAFKTAFATSDFETILSALGNHRARIGADVMILATLDGTIVADTLHPGARGAPLSFTKVIEAASEKGLSEISSIVFLDRRPYQLVIVPLLIPVPSAWICVGFLMEDTFAAEFGRQTLSHVSLLARPQAGAWASFATTLSGAESTRLPDSLDAISWSVDRSVSMDMGSGAYVTLVTPVGVESENEVVVVLQRSLAEALAPYQRLQAVLILLFSGGVVLTAVVSTLIARSVTRPVLLLASSAGKVEAGDYSQRLEIPQKDEIGELAASFNEMVKGLEEKERVRSLLGKVVSPEVARELLSKKVELGGEEREVTVLFSDVRDFTALSESRSPQEIVSLLNVFLTRMSGVIEANGGVVDKYVGDAIMAIFGAPLRRRDDPVRAVRTALDMAKAMGALNDELRRDGVPPLGIGIGVNTAEVVAGNMGSATRLNYTVIGDGVNLASRLEGLTKVYGVPILVSQSTKSQAPGFLYREIDTARVKGKRQTVTLYQPLGEGGEADADTLFRLGAFHEALADLRRRDWLSARERIRALLAAAPGERLYSLYLERIEDYLVNPPSQDWDGAFTHLEK